MEFPDTKCLHYNNPGNISVPFLGTFWLSLCLLVKVILKAFLGLNRVVSTKDLKSL